MKVNGNIWPVLITALLAIGVGLFFFREKIGLTAPKSFESQELMKRELTLKQDLIDIWTTHGSLVREYIISTFANIPNKEIIKNNLEKNKDLISGIVFAFYGPQAGTTFRTLFGKHIQLDGDYAEAVKANNKEKIKEIDNQLHESAQQIGKFFAELNPQNWSEEQMTTMLFDHLKYTAGEVNARAQQDWQADSNSASKNKEELTKMAKELTTGIVKQFAGKHPQFVI